MRLVAVCGAETTPVLCCRLATSAPVSTRFFPYCYYYYLSPPTCSLCESPPSGRHFEFGVKQHAVLAEVSDGLEYRQERYGFSLVSRPLRGIGCQPLLLTCPRRQKIW